MGLVVQVKSDISKAGSERDKINATNKTKF